MARFIEVTPIKYGEEKPRMLINTEKIDYVKEENKYVSGIYVRDIPLGLFDKPVFDNPIYVAVPFIFLSEEIMEAKEVE